MTQHADATCSDPNCEARSIILRILDLFLTANVGDAIVIGNEKHTMLVVKLVDADDPEERPDIVVLSKAWNSAFHRDLRAGACEKLADTLEKIAARHNAICSAGPFTAPGGEG